MEKEREKRLIKSAIEQIWIFFGRQGAELALPLILLFSSCSILEEGKEGRDGRGVGRARS